MCASLCVNMSMCTQPYHLHTHAHTTHTLKIKNAKLAIPSLTQWSTQVTAILVRLRYLQIFLVRFSIFSFCGLVRVVHFDWWFETVASNICSLSVANRNISYCSPLGPASAKTDNSTQSGISRPITAPSALSPRPHNFFSTELHFKNQLSFSA